MALKPAIAFALMAVLGLGPRAEGPCPHCEAPAKPVCHGATGSGSDHGKTAHGRLPRPERRGCSCAGHHLCGAPPAPRAAVLVALSPQPRMAKDHSGILGVVAKASTTRPWHIERPAGRASPAPYRAPLYLTTHALLI